MVCQRFIRVFNLQLNRHSYLSIEQMVLHKELGVAQKKLFRQSVLQNERSIFSLLVLKLEVQKKKKKKECEVFHRTYFEKDK